MDYLPYRVATAWQLIYWLLGVPKGSRILNSFNSYSGWLSHCIGASECTAQCVQKWAENCYSYPPKISFAVSSKVIPWLEELFALLSGILLWQDKRIEEQRISDRRQASEGLYERAIKKMVCSIKWKLWTIRLMTDVLAYGVFHYLEKVLALSTKRDG